MFFLGVLVGRGSIEVDLSPSEVARELAVIPDKQAVPLLEKEAQALPATPPPVELSFYKEVRQSEEAITKSSRMTKAETPVLTPRVAATRPSGPVSDATVLPPAIRVTQPVPETAITPPTEGFTIQVAAHIQEAAAESEAKALRAKGFPAYFMASKNTKGQTWYRVRVGHFTDRAVANQELTLLARLKTKAYVVKL